MKSSSTLRPQCIPHSSPSRRSARKREKPAIFNAATKFPVVVPITNGGEFARRIGFAVPISGIKTAGIVRCDQPRVLDLATRRGRKVDTLPAELMDEVLAKIATLFA
ncbi:MAG: type II toxin-antitoxin system PemK/MazF family toxin [Hyphomicrobiales bacterium]|nr:type II toxin-antitoxin system PemK/MazF family toxin [Hyphomicrobiales bacterium]